MDPAFGAGLGITATRSWFDTIGFHQCLGRTTRSGDLECVDGTPACSPALARQWTNEHIERDIGFRGETRWTQRYRANLKVGCGRLTLRVRARKGDVPLGGDPKYTDGV